MGKATIPNVVMRWCHKEAQCKWCPEKIEEATPMVVVYFWNKGNEEQRGFNVQQCYHPQCWVEQGLDYLRLHPYVPNTYQDKSGRSLNLSPEDSRQRFLLTRRFNALYQRKGKIKATGEQRERIEEGIIERMGAIATEMIKYGGVPKSWLEKLK